MCPSKPKRIKYVPYPTFFPNIPNVVEIIQDGRKKKDYKQTLADIYDAPRLHLGFLIVWASFYISLMYVTSNGIGNQKPRNFALSNVTNDQLVSSRKLFRYFINHDTLDSIDNHIAVTTDCCVFRVAMILSVAPMLFNYLISSLVWDVRYLKQGLEAGNLLSMTFFIIVLGYAHSDTVSGSQSDWTYTFPTLLHYFTLSSSFSTVILMNSQLSACLNMKRPKAGEKVAKGALLYRPLHFFKWAAMIFVFIIITLAFLLSRLHPPWYLHWCDNFCWLTNRWIFFAFYAPALSLFVCTLLAVVPNANNLSSFESKIREEPLTSIVIDFNKHFHAYTIIYLTWVFGTYTNYHNSYMLREAYSLIIALQTFWYMSKPLENGFGNVFITPFYALQDRLLEYLEEHKDDMAKREPKEK